MKKDTPFMSFIFYYFPLQPSRSVHRVNKFREDPVTKISSTEFAVFGPAKPEHSFLESFCT